jgi:hypothetical protein
VVRCCSCRPWPRTLAGARRPVVAGAGGHLPSSSRPHTIGYGPTKSPVGQLAWIIEKFHDWNKAVKTPGGEVGRDRLLANATLYWLTGTATSSAQFYYESAAHLGKIFTRGVAPSRSPSRSASRSSPRTRGSPIRKFAERDYSTITHGSEFDRGGQFAAMEQPELYVGDLRTFVGSLDGR